MAEDKTFIFTTFGSDGAATAALLLQAFPAAKMVLTSANRLPDSLRDIEGKGGRVIICGVGAGENLSVLLQSLAEMPKRLTVEWLCGRGYLDACKPELAEHCECVFLPAASNAECALMHYKIERSRSTGFILELAEDFSSKRADIPELRQWWHDYIKACAGQYFKYGDSRAYLDCIRKLSGKQAISELDRNLVDAWRKGGERAQPIGNSPAMQNLRGLIGRIGPVEAPVLILGPSGAGKEVAARLLHETSKRAGAPFVAINCAILSASADMASDRLFGHVAGAFTGASKDGIGAFEAAEGGTLFLDEVAELPLEAQTKLLRALEEREITPLGTVKARAVNVRVLAATNRSLPRMVREGAFRLDLYHRLNVLRLQVPSLAERRDDIRSIGRAVLHELKGEGYPLTLREEDWRAAEEYEWPGNIRQLANLLRRAAYLGQSLREIIEQERREDAQEAGESGGCADARFRLFLPNSAEAAQPEAEIRRAYIRHVYALCGESPGKAAQILKISPNTIRSWV